MDLSQHENILPFNNDDQHVTGGGWWTVDDGGWWMGSKKFLRFFSKFCQMKFIAYNLAVFWKIFKKLSLSEKNPTSSFKIGGISRKKNLPQIS